MQRRGIVFANDDCREETTQSLSSLGTSSYGGQHRVSELLQKSTGISLELSFQIRTPNHIQSCPHKNSPLAKGGIFEWFYSTFSSHCSTRGNEYPCLIFWRRQKMKRANSPNVCQQWRQHAFPWTHWGTILKCSLNLETPFLRFVYISLTRTSLLTSYLHRCWTAPREHQRKSRLIESEVSLHAIPITLSFPFF